MRIINNYGNGILHGKLCIACEGWVKVCETLN